MVETNFDTYNDDSSITTTTKGNDSSPETHASSFSLDSCPPKKKVITPKAPAVVARRQVVVTCMAMAAACAASSKTTTTTVSAEKIQPPTQHSPFAKLKLDSFLEKEGLSSSQRSITSCSTLDVLSIRRGGGSDNNDDEEKSTQKRTTSHASSSSSGRKKTSSNSNKKKTKKRRSASHSSSTLSSSDKLKTTSKSTNSAKKESIKNETPPPPPQSPSSSPSSSSGAGFQRKPAFVPPKSTSASTQKRQGSAAPKQSSSKTNIDTTKQKNNSTNPQSPKQPQKSQQQQQPLNEIASSILKQTNYYAILGLSTTSTKSITSTQITKAYRRRCVVTHPDKMPNSDRRAFDKVSEAYDVLNDETKRVIYDRYGLEGLKNPNLAAGGGGMGGFGGFGSGGMRGAMGGVGGIQEHILKSFFGNSFSSSTSSSSPNGFSSRMSQQFKPKNSDVKYSLEVSLEDLYSGATYPVAIAQPPSPSPSQPSYRFKQQKEVEVTITPGLAAGETIRLSGEVDHIPNATPADVIFVIVQKRHLTFTRKGHDLAMEMTLSLREAICGFEREITHLDGRKVNISGPSIRPMSPFNDDDDDDNDDCEIVPKMIESGDIHVLKGEGMPRRQGRRHQYHDSENDIESRYLQYGDLYVQYKVDMPTSLSSRNRKKLEENLTNEERGQLGALLDKLEGRIPEKKESDEEDNTAAESPVYRLSPAVASDFGRASGPFEAQDDGEEHLQQDDDEDRGAGFQYFSSNPGGRSRTQFFSSMGSSFPNSAHDDGEVQCQQM